MSTPGGSRSVSGLRHQIDDALERAKFAREPAPPDALDGTGGFVARRAKAASRERRIAIFSIHGISPIQRYGFQDQVGIGWRGFLESWTGRRWSATVVWPEPAARQAPSIGFVPSALRIKAEPLRDSSTSSPAPRVVFGAPSEDADTNDEAETDESAPGPVEEAVFDVFEGYWSPLSKGRTNIASLLAWLMRCTFAASSSTATLPCPYWKLFWDFGYIGTVLLGAVSFAVLAFVLGSRSLSDALRGVPSSTASTNVTLAALLADPLKIFALPRWIYVDLAIDVAIAYLLVQVVILFRSGSKAAKAAVDLSEESVANAPSTFRDEARSATQWHQRATALLIGVVVVLAVVEAIASRGIQDPQPKICATALLTFAYLSLRIARAAADFLVEDVLGDVCVYSDHDTTSANYAVRCAIIETVAEALERVLTVAEPYDAVHILGHSLGSTIGLDTLLRVRQSVERGAIHPRQWNAIRTFTTFGSALEKTKFFFDVRNPTLSAAQDQWAGDVYGPFFTANVSDARNTNQVLYWQNFLYWNDIVANRLVSFVSDVAAGSKIGQPAPASQKNRRVVENFSLKPNGWITRFVHGDYLGDPNFWLQVGTSIVDLSSNVSTERWRALRSPDD
jgi:pimeloyl-ACP methyl ester carboxylesterase/preprotein translocase subunit SecG